MRLLENKRDIIDDKVFNRVYWKEENIRNSMWGIGCIQKIWVYILINSDYLFNIVFNEINRK